MIIQLIYCLIFPLSSGGGPWLWVQCYSQHLVQSLTCTRVRIPVCWIGDWIRGRTTAFWHWPLQASVEAAISTSAERDQRGFTKKTMSVWAKTCKNPWRFRTTGNWRLLQSRADMGALRRQSGRELSFCRSAFLTCSCLLLRESSSPWAAVCW